MACKRGERRKIHSKYANESIDTFEKHLNEIILERLKSIMHMTYRDVSYNNGSKTIIIKLTFIRCFHILTFEKKNVNVNWFLIRAFNVVQLLSDLGGLGSAEEK